MPRTRTNIPQTPIDALANATAESIAIPCVIVLPEDYATNPDPLPAQLLMSTEVCIILCRRFGCTEQDLYNAIREACALGGHTLASLNADLREAKAVIPKTLKRRH